MDPPQAAALRRVQGLLARELDLGRGCVLDRLAQCGVISASDEESYVLSQPTRRQQVLALLGLLKRCGAERRVIPELAAALRAEPGTEHLGEALLAQQEAGGSPLPVEGRRPCGHCALRRYAQAPDLAECLNAQGYLSDDSLEGVVLGSLSRRQRMDALLAALRASPRCSGDGLGRLVRAAVARKSYGQPVLQALEGAHTAALLYCTCAETTAIRSSDSMTTLNLGSVRTGRSVISQHKKRPGNAQPRMTCCLTEYEDSDEEPPVMRVSAKVQWCPAGPVHKVQQAVELCMLLDKYICLGKQRFRSYTKNLLVTHPNCFDVRANITNHKLLAEIWGDFDLARARALLSRGQRYLARASCPVILEMDLTIQETRILQHEGRKARALECIQGAVQRAELLAPQRVLGFVYEMYAQCLVHLQERGLLSRQAPTLAPTIECLYLRALQNFSASAAVDHVEDEWSQGVDTFIRLVFFHLRTCLAGHFLDHIRPSKFNIKAAFACLQRLERIHCDTQLPPRLRCRHLLALCDYELRKDPPELGTALGFCRLARALAARHLPRSPLVEYAKRRMEHLGRRMEPAHILAHLRAGPECNRPVQNNISASGL